MLLIVIPTTLSLQHVYNIIIIVRQNNEYYQQW